MLDALRERPQLAFLRRVLGPLTAALFAILAVALLLGRFPLPGGESFSYNSLARNMVIVALVGHLVGADGLRFTRSPVGTALLLYLAAAVLSIAANRGWWGDLRGFAAAVGVFYTARAFAGSPTGMRWVFHWLGIVAVGVVLREIVADPAILAMHESARENLVTDHPNTLGFLFALLTPLFLGRIEHPEDRRPAILYAAVSILGVALTFSRSAWLGLTLAVIAVGFAARAREGRPGPAPGVVLAGTAAALGMGLVVAWLSMGRGEADAQRLRIIETSFSLFREHPLFGIGFGSRNLGTLFPARYIELFGQSLFLFHSHNFAVDALTGSGIPGALAAVWLLLRLVQLALRAWRRPGDLSRIEGVSLAASIGVFLMLCLMDMPFYHGRLMFLFVVAWAYVERRVDVAEQAPSRWSSGAGPDGDADIASRLVAG